MLASGTNGPLYYGDKVANFRPERSFQLRFDGALLKYKPCLVVGLAMLAHLDVQLPLLQSSRPTLFSDLLHWQIRSRSLCGVFNREVAPQTLC